MGGLLDGSVFMGPTAVGPILGGETAAKQARNPMAQYLKNSGLLQADTAGKRMAAASGVVWQ
jgi:hypothetical protein